MKDGWVCLEFFKCCGNEERITDIFHISPDGQEVKFCLILNSDLMNDS